MKILKGKDEAKDMTSSLGKKSVASKFDKGSSVWWVDTKMEWIIKRIWTRK